VPNFALADSITHTQTQVVDAAINFRPREGWKGAMANQQTLYLLGWFFLLVAGSFTAEARIQNSSGHVPMRRLPLVRISSDGSWIACPVVPCASMSDKFRATVVKAGFIFDGTVTAVEAKSTREGILWGYRVSFRVGHGIRGVRTGTTLSILQWAGLWGAAPNGRMKYRVGERDILFLYPISHAGLTSPVGGVHGKLAVAADGTIALPSDWPGNRRRISLRRLSERILSTQKD
jgi:hypothetical protein